MNDFLFQWLSLSLSGSLVAFILFLLKPMLRRFSKRWQYYIWLLVVLRLLIPFSPDVSTIGDLFGRAESHFSSEYAPLDESAEKNLSFLPEPFNSSRLEHNTIEQTKISIIDFSFWSDHFFGILWLSISMILFIRKIYGYRQFVREVKKESQIVVDIELLTALKMVSTEMGIKKEIPLYTNSLLRAPMLVGVIRPAIIVPTKVIPPLQLKHIYRHELTHYLRMDFLYKWLAEIAVCLHWFNPFAYWVKKQINRDCELSCDEAVVVRMSIDERQAYGETLLDSIVVTHMRKRKVVYLSLNEDVDLLKERLGALMLYRRKSKITLFAAVVITSILLCGTVLAGGYNVETKHKQMSSDASEIQINSKEVSSGGKISLGSRQLISGTECQVLMNWVGENPLDIECTSKDGTKELYSIENGKNFEFEILEGGEYSIAVKNNNSEKIEDVIGTIKFTKSSENQQSKDTNSSISPIVSSVQSIIYENVEMRRYEGEDGHPYIHNIIKNSTEKGIESYQYGMLVFDKNGKSLKINWWSTDPEGESTYFYLDETSTKIPAGEIYDERGGWSLNVRGMDFEVEKIAYVLYCSKEVKFEDGTIWVNPDYEEWRKTYEGQSIAVDTLEKYYPYEQKIDFTTKSSDIKKPIIKVGVSGKRAIKVTWKKDNKSTGYQIQISTDKKYKKRIKSFTIKKNKTTSYTAKKLAGKKTYFVRLRSYKTVSGKKYYSSWSSVKKVRTR